MARELSCRIWDKKHKRWFQGGTDKKSRKLQTDLIHLFGETVACGEVFHDQNEDDIWKDENIMLPESFQYLEAVESIGIRDTHGWEICRNDYVLIKPKQGSKINLKDTEVYGVVLYDDKRAAYYLKAIPNGGDVGLSVNINTDEVSLTIVGNAYEGFDETCFKTKKS